MLEKCIQLDKQYGDSNEKITGVHEKLESLSVELDQLKSYLETNGDKVDASSQTAIDHLMGKLIPTGKR